MSKELGSYSPAFFKMKVNVDGDIDLNSMSPSDFSVFMHEYIHFIQDFTTAAGCRRIYVYGEYIRQCVRQITEGPRQFHVPIAIPKYENNVLPNFDLLDRVEGDNGKMTVVAIDRIETMDEEVVDRDGRRIRFKSVVVWTKGDNPISFGTYSVKESMAYLVEQLCSTRYAKSPDFPYNMARLVADYVVGKNILDDITLLALCDVSLLTSNPGLSFYELVKLIKKGAVTVDKPEDIYDYFYLQRSIQYDTGEIVLAISDYLLSAGLAWSTLKQYYSLERLRDLNEWLDKVFVIGMNLRLNDKYFMLKMARDGKDKRNIVLQYFARTIGSPLMENKQGQMYKLRLCAGEPPTEFLFVLEQLFYLFKKGLLPCDMKPWCDKNPGIPLSPADDRCVNAPWSRCQDGNLCPYALFWHHRKLTGFTPVK